MHFRGLFSRFGKVLPIICRISSDKHRKLRNLLVTWRSIRFSPLPPVPVPVRLAPSHLPTPRPRLQLQASARGRLELPLPPHLFAGARPRPASGDRAIIPLSITFIASKTATEISAFFTLFYLLVRHPWILLEMSDIFIFCGSLIAKL